MPPGHPTHGAGEEGQGQGLPPQVFHMFGLREATGHRGGTLHARRIQVPLQGWLPGQVQTWVLPFWDGGSGGKNDWPKKGLGSGVIFLTLSMGLGSKVIFLTLSMELGLGVIFLTLWTVVVDPFKRERSVLTMFLIIVLGFAHGICERLKVSNFWTFEWPLN